MKTDKTVSEILNHISKTFDQEVSTSWKGHILGKRDFMKKVEAFFDNNLEGCHINIDKIQPCSLDVMGHESDCPLAESLLAHKGTKENCYYWKRGNK